MAEKKRMPRDPEGRKRAIVAAAAALIEREGTRKLTHRRIAEEAGVPLGSTTAYFASIDELRHAGLEELGRQIDTEYDEMFDAIERAGNTADAIADELNAYLADARQVTLDATFYTAALHDPAMGELIKRTFARAVEKCRGFADDERALLMTVLLDGLTVDTALLGKPPHPDFVRRAVGAIMNATELMVPYADNAPDEPDNTEPTDEPNGRK